jgi:hypothetical protein
LHPSIGLLSRSGEQLYEHDSFLPARFNQDHSSSSESSSPAPSGLKKLVPFAKGKEKAEPLLKIMADPRYSFYRALARFERIEVFANTCALSPPLPLVLTFRARNDADVFTLSPASTTALYLSSPVCSLLMPPV